MQRLGIARLDRESGDHDDRTDRDGSEKCGRLPTTSGAANRVLDAPVADDRQQEGDSEQHQPSVERERAAFVLGGYH